MICEQALTYAETHIDKVTHFFKEEGHPVPTGYSEDDLNLEAPPLFTDKMYLLLY
jgi:hypothetical protein